MKRFLNPWNSPEGWGVVQVMRGDLTRKIVASSTDEKAMLNRWVRLQRFNSQLHHELVRVVFVRRYGGVDVHELPGPDVPEDPQFIALGPGTFG